MVLSIMHASKGLEYTVVFIMDANEKITPHSRAVTEADIEEERRLFYVAATRAKQKLHLCWVKERFGKKMEKSRFVQEMSGKNNHMDEKRNAEQLNKFSH